MHTNYTLVPFIPHDSYMYCTIVDFEFTTFSIILAEFFFVYSVTFWLFIFV